MVGRIPVMNVMPLVDLGRQPAKATVGEPFKVSATVFREGHDKLSAEVVLTDRGVQLIVVLYLAIAVGCIYFDLQLGLTSL